MNRTFPIASLFILSLVVTAQNARAATSDEVELKGPIPTQAAGAVQQSVPESAPVPVSTPAPAKQAQPEAGLGLAPGEDGTMTRDMILVSPTNPQQDVGKPLSELTGKTLKMQIDQSDIIFDTLRGVMITVTNDTNRPMVVDGDQAKAIIGGKSYTCVPVSAIQQAIVPHFKMSQEFEDILTHAVPAAITVGAAPTIRDYKTSKKPILERYGPDELRRKIEFSRFGKRILWTQQKMQGIVYFQADDQLTGSQIQIPATTLFDDKDTAILTSTP